MFSWGIRYRIIVVLGVAKKISGSVDDILDAGFYDIEWNTDNPYGNGEMAVMYVNKVQQSGTTYILQIAYRIQQPTKVRWKWGNSFTDWSNLEYDIPTFYKDYGSLSALMEAERTARKGNLLSVSLSHSDGSQVGYGLFILEDATAGGDIALYINSADDGVIPISVPTHMQQFTVVQSSTPTWTYITTTSTDTRNMYCYPL